LPVIRPLHEFGDDVGGFTGGIDVVKEITNAIYDDQSQIRYLNRTLKTGSDGKDRHYYSFSGRIGRLHGRVYNKRNKYIRTLPGRFQPSIQFVTIDVEMLSLFYNRNIVLLDLVIKGTG